MKKLIVFFLVTGCVIYSCTKMANLQRPDLLDESAGDQLASLLLTTVTMGKTTVGAANNSCPANELDAFKFTAAQSFSATVIKVYVVSSTGALKCAIYAHDATNNRPGALLKATNAIATPTANQWNTFTLTTPQAIANGTSYWLAFWGNGNYVIKTETSGGTGYYKTATYGTWPSPAGTGSSSTWVSSIYAEGQDSTAVVPVTSVTLTPDSTTINVGNSYQLTTTVLPANATNKNVTYTSTNPAIASVNATGLVTALAVGNTYVKVITQDGNKVDSSKIKVQTAPVSGWPDGTNTGYQHAPGYPGSLTAWGGGAIQSNTTYSFIDFPGGADVGLTGTPVTNVKFIGCRFHGTGPGGAMVMLRGNDLTFEYCTIEPDVTPVQYVTYAQSYQYGLCGGGSYNTSVGKLTVKYCNIWGYGNAIDVTPTTDPAKPQVYQHNYIHHAADINNDVYHHDGIGATGNNVSGSYVTIDHNTIESEGNTNAIAYQAVGPWTYFTVTNNLIGGFNRAVSFRGPNNHHITFTDNTFSTKVYNRLSPLDGDNWWLTTGSSWKRNKWKVPAGAAWGNPIHDGWFWIPAGADHQGSTDDTQYVSQTDF